MASSGVDCWLTRVEKIQKILNMPNKTNFKKKSGKLTTSFLKSKFDRYWLDCINETKTTNNDQQDHNKLRTYKTYKCSFSREPYIDLVKNRNQRSSLSRLRTGSHFLGIERGRWTRPVTPLDKRTCPYCSPPSTRTPSSPSPGSTPSSPSPGPVDDEKHFMVECNRFAAQRTAAFIELSSLLPCFKDMSESDQFITLMCPTQPKSAKIAHRLIKTMFELRDKIDQDKNNPTTDQPNM